MRHLFRKFLFDEGGGPAIEFALVATFLALSLPAVMDITTIINNYIRLSGGMRAGQQFAIKYPNNTGGIESAIESASNLPADSVTVTTEQFCECNGLGNSCASTCSGGYALAKYITVHASYNMNADYNYENDLYPSSLSNQITVRIQ